MEIVSGTRRPAGPGQAGHAIFNKKLLNLNGFGSATEELSTFFEVEEFEFHVWRNSYDLSIWILHTYSGTI